MKRNCPFLETRGKIEMRSHQHGSHSALLIEHGNSRIADLFRKRSKSMRRILDEGGLKETIIFASGGIEEDTLAAFTRQGAPINGIGVGTMSQPRQTCRCSIVHTSCKNMLDCRDASAR